MAENRRNILVFVTDDHAQWALGCYGNREIQSPNLDHLAATGVRMANSFTPIPVCSPARACLLTGLYPSQHGIHDWIWYLGHRPDLPSEFETVNDRQWLVDESLADTLGGGGYQTGLVGKWHVGRDTVPQAGFGHWYALHHHYPPRGGDYSDNGTPVHRAGYHTDIITDEAIRYLNDRDGDRPFFLYVGFIGTHTPWQEHPERLVARFRDASFADIPDDPVYRLARMRDEVPDRSQARELRAQYYAGVAHIDEGVGRIVDELEALGLRDDTLVVYTADHGINLGQHGIWGKGNGTRPLNMLEESIRVPLVVNCPGTLLAHQTRSELVDHCDLHATLLDWAGISPRRDKPSPGRSFLPMLTRGAADRGWKTAQPGEYGPLRTIRTERYKLVRRYPDGYHELYDLALDPREAHNRFDDPAYAPVVDELTRRLDAFYERYEDPEKSGLRARELPAHNPREAWRGEPEDPDSGTGAAVASPW